MRYGGSEVGLSRSLRTIGVGRESVDDGLDVNVQEGFDELANLEANSNLRTLVAVGDKVGTNSAGVEVKSKEEVDNSVDCT